LAAGLVIFDNSTVLRAIFCILVFAVVEGYFFFLGRCCGALLFQQQAANCGAHCVVFWCLRLFWVSVGCILIPQAVRLLVMAGLSENSFFFSGCGDFLTATKLLENFVAFCIQRSIQRPFSCAITIFRHIANMTLCRFLCMWMWHCIELT
jgi:hypothetical protein